MYKKDSDTYDIYLLPPGEDVETCTSWLRMRNRDGRYNLMFEEWVTDGPFIISPRITFEVRRAAAAALQARLRCLMPHLCKECQCLMRHGHQSLTLGSSTTQVSRQLIFWCFLQLQFWCMNMEV